MPEEGGERTADEILEDIQEKFEPYEINDKRQYRGRLDKDEYLLLERIILEDHVAGDEPLDAVTAIKIRLGRLGAEIKEEYESIEEEWAEFLESEGEELAEEIGIQNKRDIQQAIDFAEQRAIDLSILIELYDKVILFFVLTSTAIEEFSTELLLEEMFTSEFKDSNRTQKIADSFSQEMREQLLLRTGILEEDLVSELGHIRNVRNSLLHDIGEQQFLEPTSDIIAELNRSLDAVNELHLELHGVPFIES